MSEASASRTGGMDATSRCLSFLCDERVQNLSAQAESFLNRLREMFTRYPMALDEHGRAPADPAQLRNLTYPHRPDIRYTYVARWFAEIEAASLVTVEETSLGRWFALADSGAARKGQVESRKAKVDSCSLPSPIAMPNSDGARQTWVRPALIHNPVGLSPPELKEIAAVAAAATSVSDFIGRAREAGWFAGFDLETEWNDYVDHRRKKERPSTLENFVATWAPRMQRRFGKVEKKRAVTPIPTAGASDSANPASDQPDLFEQASMKWYREQASRRSAAHAEKKAAANL